MHRSWNRQLGIGAVALLLPLVMSSGTTSAQVSPGPLSKAHASLEGNRHCLDCHDIGGGELEAKCLDCHNEIAWLREQGRGFHARDGNGDCKRCHPEHAGHDFDLIEWDEGSPERFEHRRAGWKLEGRHAELDCRSCHKAEFSRGPASKGPDRSGPFRSWLGLENSCASCHADVHLGALGDDCSQCHTQSARKPVPGFDHKKTSYPLQERHLQVMCDGCHRATFTGAPMAEDGKPQPLYKPLPHADCTPCHSDPHAGRFTGRCAACHVVAGFELASSAGLDHGLTRFPLRGAHASTRCERCHDPETAWGKRPPFARCADCHLDAHGGTATLAGQSVDCDACHDERAFSPGRLSLAEHAESGYPLQGRHATTACAGCHRKNDPRATELELGSAGVWIRPEHGSCQDCHADAHAGQLATSDDSGRCENCHDPTAWRPSRFGRSEHAALGLPLEGAHERTACTSCHAADRSDLSRLPATLDLGSARFAFRLAERRCGDCHLDPHGGRYEQADNWTDLDGCRGCHHLEGFAPSTLTPTRHTELGFQLVGTHHVLPCFECHDALSGTRASSSLLASGTTMRALGFTEQRKLCSQCHGDPHAGQFAGGDGISECERCHGQVTFRLADRFDHVDDANFALEGAHAPLACKACHPTRTAADGTSFVLYRLPGHDCRDCHRRGDPALAEMRGDER